MSTQLTIKQRAERLLANGSVTSKTEATAKARLEASAERLDAAKKKIKTIESARRRYEAAQTKKRETRRLILIGRVIDIHQSKIPESDVNKFCKWLNGILNACLTKDTERAIFGLQPKQKSSDSEK